MLSNDNMLLKEDSALFNQTKEVEKDDPPPSYVSLDYEVERCKELVTLNTDTNKIHDVLVQANNEAFPEAQNNFESQTPAKTMIDIEIQRAELRRQQLAREKELTEEVFKAKERILEAEMTLALTRMQTGYDIALNNFGVSANSANAFSNASAPPEIPEPDQIQLPLNNIIPAVPSLQSGVASLDQLRLVETINIKQVPHSSLDEMYKMIAPDGNVLFNASIIFGKKGITRGVVYDNQWNEVIKFYPSMKGLMEVLGCNERVCLLKRQPSFLKPIVTVNDIFNSVLLKIKHQQFCGGTVVFKIETVTKVTVGGIKKALHSTALEEGLETYDSCITFPKDLDVNCKAAVIACSFLIVSKAQEKMRYRKRIRELNAYPMAEKY